MKLRKRIGAIGVCMVLLFSLCACGGSSNKIVGKWIHEYEPLPNGFVMADDFMWWEFYEDGTYEQGFGKYKGNPAGRDSEDSYNTDGEGTWVILNDGRIKVTEKKDGTETYSYSIKGNKLILDGDTYKKVK